MHTEKTMTGSWFRSEKIKSILLETRAGEVPTKFREIVLEEENKAVQKQVDPMGKGRGLTVVSNGEQRKSGYTTFVKSRFEGFDGEKIVAPVVSSAMLEELRIARSPIYDIFKNNPEKLLGHPQLNDRISYNGQKKAELEAKDLKKIGRDNGVSKVFVNSPSPGVLAQFLTPGTYYRDYYDFIEDLSREMSKEYEAILSVDGVQLQIDAPDLTHERHYRKSEETERTSALNARIDSINRAISGKDPERIRVHYCFGNYSAPHIIDPPLENFLHELLSLNSNLIVAELANPRHEGDAMIFKRYVKEYGWPKEKKIAVGVIDVKTSFVETPETVALRLARIAEIDGIGPERVMAGTDCGFETFSSLDNVSEEVALMKLDALAEGTALFDEMYR
jgi:5-methyltetrahydropteroyltriglutamate--homocysteine methyltransferase